MRLFGSERIARLMDRMGAQEGEVLTHPLITRSIEQAQKRVELQNFQSRKRLLEYDDVMNQQREVIYSLRAFALEGGEELKGEALKMVEKALGRRVETVLAEYETVEEWDFDLLRQELLIHYMIQLDSLANPDHAADGSPRGADAGDRAGRAAFEAKLGVARPGAGRAWAATATGCCRYVMLNVLDEKWKDHLYDLDQLRNAIHYRSWGQKDPLIEYKQEAYTMFVDLMNDICGDLHGAVPQGAAHRRAAAADDGAGAYGDGRRAGSAGADEALQRARRARGRRPADDAAAGGHGRRGSARRRSGGDAGAGAEHGARSAIR